MIELGCGWGCWMNNMGAAARSTGRDIHVIGVEGDVGHIAFAHEALARNGFTPDQWTVVNGIAAGRHGVALFPRQDHAGASWGLEPVFGATDEQRDAAVASGSHDVLPMIPLDQIAGAHDRIDLLHIDIQGGEADLIEECLPTLNEKVAYVVVGTHSRQIEGRLFDMMLAAGWLLEMERPAILSVAGPSPVVTVDGLQGWRNRRILP
jgi:FkbM family methyltransferase